MSGDHGSEIGQGGEEEEEPWLSREEIVEREYQIKGREYDELQRLIAERCEQAARDWAASHPWAGPRWCTSVPVPLVRIVDPQSP